MWTLDLTPNHDATLTWSTNANVDGYALYRSGSPNGTYVLRACIPLSRGAYVDSAVNSGQTYYYKIRGYRLDGQGGWIYGDYSSPIQVTVK